MSRWVRLDVELVIKGRKWPKGSRIDTYKHPEVADAVLKMQRIAPMDKMIRAPVECK